VVDAESVVALRNQVESRGGGEVREAPVVDRPVASEERDPSGLVEDDHHDRGVRANARDVHLHVVGETTSDAGDVKTKSPRKTSGAGPRMVRNVWNAPDAPHPPPRLRRPRPPPPRRAASVVLEPRPLEGLDREEAGEASNEDEVENPRRARVDGGDGELDPEEDERRDERDREGEEDRRPPPSSRARRRTRRLPRMSRSGCARRTPTGRGVDAPDDRLTEPPVRPSVLSLVVAAPIALPGPAW
jgi:hypothetical protein